MKFVDDDDADDDDSRMLTGNEFQILGAENRKARDPKDRL